MAISLYYGRKKNMNNHYNTCHKLIVKWEMIEIVLT